MPLPKPLFASADETSLSLKWDRVDVSTSANVIKLQYKEHHESWTEARGVPVENNESSVKVTAGDVNDLKPGTPYYVRLVLCSPAGDIVETGPETVFDTKPVDCGPKGKSGKCVVC